MMLQFTEGSQGAQTNCAAVFMTTLDTLILSAGFTFVEQTGTAPAVCRVYKSPAAANFFATDWYLSVTRTTDTATGVSFRVFEQYNATTHLAFNYAPSATSGLTTTATYAVSDAAGKAPNATNLRGLGVDVAAAGFTYQVSASPDRVVVSTRAAGADSAVYVGLYDDMQRPAVSPFPLCVTLLITGSSAQIGSSTREPNTPSAGANFLFIHDSLNTFGTYVAAEGYSGGMYLARFHLVSARNPNLIRGLLRDVWAVPRAAAVNGDRLAATIGGVPTTLVQTRDDFAASASLQAFVPGPGSTAGTLLSGTAYGPPWDDGTFAGVPAAAAPTTGQIWPRGQGG